MSKQNDAEPVGTGGKYAKGAPVECSAGRDDEITKKVVTRASSSLSAFSSSGWTSTNCWPLNHHLSQKQSSELKPLIIWEGLDGHTKLTQNHLASPVFLDSHRYLSRLLWPNAARRKQKVWRRASEITVSLEKRWSSGMGMSLSVPSSLDSSGHRTDLISLAGAVSQASTMISYRLRVKLYDVTFIFR